MPIRPETDFITAPGPQPNQNPFAAFDRAAQYRNLLLTGQLHQQQIANEQEQLKGYQLKNQETERGTAAQRLKAQLIADNTTQDETGQPKTNAFAVIKGLSDAGHAQEATAFDTQRRADLKSQIDLEKGQLDNAKARTALVASAFGSLRDAKPEDRAALLPQVADQIEANIPGMPKGTVQRQFATPQDLNAYVEQKFQAAIDADKQVDNHREALKFTAELAAKKPETLKKWQDVAFNQASAARSQQDLDATRRSLEVADAPPEVLAQLPTMWSQTAVDALGQKAITAEQRAQNANTVRGQDMSAATAAANRQTTERGQNMTDARARELAQLARDAAAQAREDKPPTSAQSTVATYAERLRDSNKALESLTQGTGERVFNKIAPNFLETETGQAFDQAERSFINAILRRESGAVISPSEFTEARKQYIPQPGDKPAALAQKAALRKQVTESFKKAAGKAYTEPDDLLKTAPAGGSRIKILKVE